VIIDIDQSGKIEDTGVDTVIGAANSSWQKSLRLPAREKRKLQQIFREAGKSGTFPYRIFAALIFLTLEDNLDQISEIIIDEEYTGKNEIIKLFLIRFIRSVQPHIALPHITFRQIGRQSPAHDAAYLAFTKQRSVNRTVTTQEVFRLIF
jgi:hypothetical protein